MGESAVQSAVSAMVARLEADPGRAQVRYRARTELSEGMRCDVRTAKHEVVIDEPPSIAGTNAGPSPVETVLAGLAACQAITYRVWAARLGLELERVGVEAEGEIDVRGFFGTDDAARAGFSALRLDVTLTGPETPERYRELAETVDRHCPVLDMFSRPAPVTRNLVEPATASA